MDAKAWTGDDTRDSLSPDYDREDICRDCGEHITECAKTCGCKACRQRELLGETPGDEAA